MDCFQSPDSDIDIDYDTEMKKELLDELDHRSLLMRKFLAEQENEKLALCSATEIDESSNSSRRGIDPKNEDHSINYHSQINHLKEEIKSEPEDTPEVFVSDTDSCLDLETVYSHGGENGGSVVTINENISQNSNHSIEEFGSETDQTAEEAVSDYDSCFDELEDDVDSHEDDYRMVSIVRISGETHSTSKPVIRKQKKSSSKLNCTVCDYSCSQASRLLRHMRTHTKERNYLCTLCDFKCSQSADLRVHLRTHTGEKLFLCQFCDYSASRNNNLQRHLKSHTAEKPHSCSICDYSCIEAADLRAHMFKHKGIKPFSCEVCDFRAAKSSDLVKHVRIHTGEKPYKCLQCGYRCTRAYHLKCHMKRHAKSSSNKKRYGSRRIEFMERAKADLADSPTYEIKKEHLSEAELTSNLETESERMTKKRHRKEKKLTLPGDESSSDDEHTQNYQRTCRPTKKPTIIAPFPSSPPRTPELQTSKVHTNTTPPPLPSLHTQQPSPVSRHRSLSSSSSSSGHSVELSQLYTNQELMWRVLGDITETLERLEKKMDHLIALLETQRKKEPSNHISCPGSERLFAELPISPKDMGDMEEGLKEPSFRSMLMKILLALGAKDLKAYAACVMRRVFSDDVGNVYSLTGKSSKDGPAKKPFIKTESFRLVYDVCMRKYSDGQESQIREAVSDWLIQAKYRNLIYREIRKQQVRQPYEENGD